MSGIFPSCNWEAVVASRLPLFCLVPLPLAASPRFRLKTVHAGLPLFVDLGAQNATQRQLLTEASSGQWPFISQSKVFQV